MQALPEEHARAGPEQLGKGHRKTAVFKRGRSTGSKEKNKYEMRKQSESNEKDILESDHIRKQAEEEVRRGGGDGANLVVKRNQSGRCGEGRERAIEVEDLWSGRENTMYNYEEFGVPCESRECHVSQNEGEMQNQRQSR